MNASVESFAKRAEGCQKLAVMQLNDIANECDYKLAGLLDLMRSACLGREHGDDFLPEPDSLATGFQIAQSLLKEAREARSQVHDLMENRA